MTPVVVGSSDVESARFGLRVGRTRVGTDIDPRALERAAAGFDVVIVRHRAVDVDIPFRLLALRELQAFTADHLCIWRWEASTPEPVALPFGWEIRTGREPATIDAIVRDAFADYPNHYRANPLFDPAAALDGYVEWAHTLAAASDDACVLMFDATGSAVGVALIDWDEEIPDIRLAGIGSRVQGQGRYGALVSHVMQLAVDRSRTALTISTQSHNVNVMRAWSRLGFLPVDTLATVHLVRRDLLDLG